MENNKALLESYTQNAKLRVMLVTPGFGHVSPEQVKYADTHRNTLYYFLLVLKGSTIHGVDLKEYEIASGELLLVLPHQIHKLPSHATGTDYYKIGFDESCLALLPRHYPFLLNPYHQQKLSLTKDETFRLKSIFELLHSLLTYKNTDPELILAHLNSMLTEMNASYFSGRENPADEKLAHYSRFTQLIENTLSDHAPVAEIAKTLALNSNSLYAIVKHYTGLSPKGYITSRLILEAKRRLYYSESSIKELAFDLGYNDPEYFSRLFKKHTGQTITAFVQDLSGK